MSLFLFNIKKAILFLSLFGIFDAAGTPEGLTTNYTGSLDDVRIWNVALSNTEVGTEVANLYSYENSSTDASSPNASLA